MTTSPAHSSATSAPTRVIIGGTIAIDHVVTPIAEGRDLLGGSASYAALAASFFTQPVDLVGIIGHDFPPQHLAMLETHGITLTGVERSANESFTWTGEYHANMNERTTHRVGLNVLENWQVHIPAEIASASIVVLANMSPDNQLQMLAGCNVLPNRPPESASSSASASSCSSPDLTTLRPSDLPTSSPTSSSSPRFIIADTMDLWIEIASDRLHQVLPQLDLFVLNEGEARALAGTTSLVEAGALLLKKGPRHVVIKLGEFGAMLFSQSDQTATDPANPSPNLFRCTAFPIETVADPTGAGDTFLGGIAGFLAAHSAPPYDDATLRQAIVHGSILASFTCEAFSTRRLESLTAADIDTRIDQYRALTAW